MNPYYLYRFGMASVTDVFLSHNWGRDESDRNNHYRVSLINRELKRRGYKTWFDEDEMAGNIAERMSEGIEQTKAVIIFLTRKYYEKVNGKNALDNCKREFIYAVQRKTPAKILVVVMEECMRDTGTWTNLFGFYFSSRLYVDMTDNLEDRNYLHQQMESLQQQLQYMETQSLQGNLYSDLTFLYYVKENYHFFPAKYCIEQTLYCSLRISYVIW